MAKSLETITCAALVVLTLGACDTDSDSSTPGVAADQERALSFADAVATAQAEVPEGIPYEVELERVDGKDVIEVELFVGNIIREVHIDPLTGDVISVVDETDGEQSEAELAEQAALMQGATLTLADAAKAAEEQSGGEALEVEYKIVDGALVVEVEVLTDAGESVVYLDPASGEVTGTGPSEDDDDEADEAEDQP